MIAEAAASVPLFLFDGEREVDAHPLLTLIAQPNPMQCGPDLLEAWYGHLLVAGNAYLEAVSVNGQLRELHALRPDRMKVVPGADGWPEAYDYSVSGQTVRFEQDAGAGVRPILHMALFHPLNDHYGLSPLEPAATGIDLHNAAGAWNKALLDNSACPSGALVYTAKDGQLTPEQYDRLKSELEESFQGARNAGRPLLLEGGLDWKAMAFSPKDMDFIAAKHVGRARGGAGFGRAADAARHSRRQYLCQLRRGQSQLLAPDRAAAGQPHRQGADRLARARLRYRIKRLVARAAPRPRCDRGVEHRARGAVGPGAA